MSQTSSAMSLCSEKLTLWILVEGSPRPIKFPVEWNTSPDLDDLAHKLCKEKKTFENVDPESLEFFNHDDRINPLRAGTLVTNLSTTDASPLVIRYPFSNSEDKIKYFYLFDFESIHPSHLHLSVYCLEDGKKSSEEQVENEFAFNKVVEDIKLNESGKKAYGEWEISEVFEKFLHKSGSSVGDINQFDIEKFTQPDPEISDDIVNSFIGEPRERKRPLFMLIVMREFISAFMIVAVEHVQLKESKLCLKSEEWLDGSHGFGPVDYSVHLEEFVLLVCEAKKEDFEKGATQNIVQMHSAKINKKQKIDETDMEPEPQVQIYGIVTNALKWYFLKWIGSPENPQLEASGPHFCKFDMTDAKKITNYIASILQMQVSGLGNHKKQLKAQKEVVKCFLSNQKHKHTTYIFFAKELNEVIFEVIEKLEQSAKDLAEAINTAEA
ncbi:5658_t:CDS:2 [Entrophospora sp. SA101]|nr:5658_t:CDS:2 [Entrophospora sp. SA101]